MISHAHKMILRGFVGARTEGRTAVDFEIEVRLARRALKAFVRAKIDGMDVSRALRAAGFNKDRELPGVYRRAS